MSVESSAVPRDVIQSVDTLSYPLLRSRKSTLSIPGDVPPNPPSGQYIGIIHPQVYSTWKRS